MTTIRRCFTNALVAAIAITGAACANQTAAAPTAADAKQFLDTVNDTIKKLDVESNQAGWVQQNFITDDTEAIQARVNQRVTDAIARFAKESVKFDKVDVSPAERRQLNLLKLSLVMVTPSDPKEGEELTTIAARLESTYGKGKWCADPAKPDACLNIDDITKVMAESRDAARLRQVWEGWHTISPPMRKTTRGLSSCRTKARASWASPTAARCGARNTTCRPRRSRKSSIACGIRCGRCTSSFTRTCA